MTNNTTNQTPNTPEDRPMNIRRCEASGGFHYWDTASGRTVGYAHMFANVKAEPCPLHLTGFDEGVHLTEWMKEGPGHHMLVDNATGLALATLTHTVSTCLMRAWVGHKVAADGTVGPVLASWTTLHEAKVMLEEMIG